MGLYGRGEYAGMNDTMGTEKNNTRGIWIAWLVLFLVFWALLLFKKGQIESDLTHKVEKLLGDYPVDIHFDGRDGKVSGQIDSQASIAALTSLVDRGLSSGDGINLAGVRVLDLDLTDAEGNGLIASNTIGTVSAPAIGDTTGVDSGIAPTPVPSQAVTNRVASVNPASTPSSATPSTTPDSILALVQKADEATVRFLFGRSDIVAPYDAQLKELSDLLREPQHVDLDVTLIGHGDLTGSPERNVVVALARAEAVKAYLVKQELLIDRISCESRGSSEPLINEKSPKANELNRRVEIKLSHPQYLLP